jgi:hypothetical protein
MLVVIELSLYRMKLANVGVDGAISVSDRTISLSGDAD